MGKATFPLYQYESNKFLLNQFFWEETIEIRLNLIISIYLFGSVFDQLEYAHEIFTLIDEPNENRYSLR